MVTTEVRHLRNKLHISRSPGYSLWFFLSFSLITSVFVGDFLTHDATLRSILLLVILMCGLDELGKWEDLVLDKELNKATIVKSTWNEKLCLRVFDRSVAAMKLSDILHVGVSVEMGLFIIQRNGTVVTFSTRGLAPSGVQKLRKEINYFLNMNRIEYLDSCPVDPYRQLLNAPDSEDEYIRNIARDVITDDQEKRRPVQPILSRPACKDEKKFVISEEDLTRNTSSVQIPPSQEEG